MCPTEDDDDTEERSVVVRSAAALLTVGGATLVGSPVAAVVAAAYQPMAEHLLGRVVPALWNRLLRRVPAFEEGRNADGATENLADGGEDALIDAFTALQSAIDDAVATPLGRLAAEFAESTRPLDPFFFRFRDVLVRLTAEDLGYLRKLVCGMLRLGGDEGDSFTWGISDPDACFNYASVEVRVRIPAPARERLSKLFADNFLGGGGGFNMSIAQSQRLARILDVHDDAADTDIMVRSLPR